MGNNQSSGSKSATPSSSSQPPTSSPTTITTTITTTTSSSSHDGARHLTTAGIPSSRTSKDSSASSSARNILPAQAPHRSAAAPPEPSLAQAQGSTSTASSSRPMSISAASSTLPPVSSLAASPHSAVLPSHHHHHHHHHQPLPAAAPAAPIPIAEPSKPLDVPGGGAGTPAFSRTPGINRTDSEMAEAHLIASGSITDMYNSRPPRLPLPIEEEVHTPGSPILGPDESAAGAVIPELEHESSDGLTRKSSGISQTTVDDEDSHELRVDRSRPVVPTRIEWNGGGEKVYVTGTIFQWSRKQRLQPVEGKPGSFSGVIYVLPGTHHVRFVVDTIMKTSPDLPTTVDFGNNLVNYIEVSAEMAAQPPAEGAPGPDGQVKPIVAASTDAAATAAAPSAAEEAPKPAKYKPIPPRDSYRRQIPKYLVDFDQAEESPAYQSAVSAIEKLPTPPGLPGFLSKPILNAATLMKDDNSVLNMPNHTVLNHLATSSIKNNVLAVCATTRYRGKYVTTIVYKPTSADEG